MNAKIYTYAFYFWNPNDEMADSTQFCAENEQKAIELFEDFCLQDESMDAVPNFEIEVVYNAEDDALYGEAYGLHKECETA